MIEADISHLVGIIILVAVAVGSIFGLLGGRVKNHRP